MKVIRNPSNSEIIMPRFTLPAAGGRGEAGPAQYRQQSNLLILFLHTTKCEDCARLLKSLRDMEKAYAALETHILVVAGNPLNELEQAAEVAGPDIILLSDPGGATAAAYAGVCDSTSAEHSGTHPFLVITDRFGAFYSRIELEEGEPLDHGEIRSTLMFIETQCPECGVHWPPVSRYLA